MACNTCGEKPKDTAKDFTKAVIEINNPETLVLLRKVVIPASMGTEEDVPAAIGKYHNVILYYEANKHTYLYSSDGIPTLLEMEVPQELIDRFSDLEENLEQEITNREGMDEELQSNIDAVAQDLEDFKNSPDVVDIVPTYAALQAYDTSKLGDNDIVRVLQDEQHDGQSSYYRWSKTASTWTFIGVVGDYYTKTQTDTLLAGKQDVLTAGQNIQIENSTISATDTTYTAGAGLNLTGTEFSVDVTAIATQSDLTTGLATEQNTLTAGSNIQINNNTISATDTTYPDFTGTDGTTAGAAGLVPAPATTDAGKFLKADGTWDTAGSAINVVQSPGTSRTDVMSQYAATKLVYPNYSSTVLKAIKITGSTSSSAHSEEVTIGYGVSANAGRAAVGVGYQANNNGNRSVAIGNYARATADGSIAIGEGAYASTRGEMNIGTSTSASYGTSYGYNNTAYRLLTGLYDPQNDHDAATKGYVDTVVAGAGAATFTTNEWNALWA